MIVRNKCCNCKHNWKDQPGAFSLAKQKCPMCDSAYFQWRSYSKDIKKNKNKLEIPNPL